MNILKIWFLSHWEFKKKVQDKLSKDYITKIRQLIGKLNWLATLTGSNLAYHINELSSILKQEKVDCNKHINKVLRGLREKKSQIFILVLDKLDKVNIVVYNDTSFVNLLVGRFLGEYVIFGW